MDTRQKVTGAFALGSGITSFCFILMMKKQNETIRKLNENGKYMFKIIEDLVPHVPTDVLEAKKNDIDFDIIVERLKKEQD